MASVGLVVGVRPYLSKSLTELTAIANKKGVSSEVLAAVCFELTHRKSGGARKLLKQLNSSLIGSGPSHYEGGGKSRAVRGRKVEVGKALFTPSITPDIGPEARDVIERLRALRETYTEGAELLSRWGVTTALPDAILDVVFQKWAQMVSHESDEFGRSRSTLQRDLKRWQDMKNQIAREGIDD